MSKPQAPYPDPIPIPQLEDFLLKGSEQYDTVIGLLQQVLRNVRPQPAVLRNPVTSSPIIITVSISGASTATIVGPQTLAKAALIQNISTNPVTLGTSKNLAVGTGYILNAASSSGSAGDTVTVVPPPGADFVDLSLLYFNQTGTGATLSIFYFQ